MFTHARRPYQGYHITSGKTHPRFQGILGFLDQLLHISPESGDNKQNPVGLITCICQIISQEQQYFHISKDAKIVGESLYLYQNSNLSFWKTIASSVMWLYTPLFSSKLTLLTALATLSRIFSLIICLSDIAAIVDHFDVTNHTQRLQIHYIYPTIVPSWEKMKVVSDFRFLRTPLFISERIGCFLRSSTCKLTTTWKLI